MSEGDRKLGFFFFWKFRFPRALDLDVFATRRNPKTETRMVVNGRPLKRLKRRVTADLNDFLTFPAAGDGSPVPTPAGSGPFRTCVRAFLSRHALMPPPSSLFPHLLTWQILFRVGDLTLSDNGGSSPSPAVICLDVVEEDVSRSRRPIYCNQCQVVGELAH